MSLPKYPHYKPSGVQWLGEVPAHWDVLPLKRDLQFVTSGSRGWADNYADDGDLFIRIGNLTRDSIRLSLADVQRVLVPEGAEGARTKVQVGDVLFSITAYLGSVAVVPESLGTAYVSQHVALARPANNLVSSEWIAYVASSMVGQTFLQTQGYGGTKVQLSLDDIASLVLTVPPRDEQAQIVSFLEAQAAKIDALIAEQEKLIRLLAEKRRATISHAVTRGLDPAAPMKDSGVAWLGEVPAHWAVTPLKHLVNFRSGGTPSKEKLNYWNGDVPWASAKDLKTDRLADTIDHITAAAIEEKAADLVPRGAVLVVVRGMILARMFPVSIVDTPMAINQDLKAVIPGERIDSEFLAWLLRGTSDDSLRRLDEAGHGTKALRMDAWASMFLPVPPIPEQARIAQFIEQEMTRLAQLQNEAERAIALLKERRAALIAAAVTGQIDVRQAVAA
jgi:type I restriction enzyme S subunit